MYRRRFAGIEQRRADVWQTLARHYFHRWVKPTDTVVDVGAGYCEFINSISAAHKYALDSNPATADKAAPGVMVLSSGGHRAVVPALRVRQRGIQQQLL